MVGFSFAEYSINNINALQDDNNPNQPNYSAALELDYRFQINRWSYVQPYLQYIVKPNGTGAVENATVMGFEVGVYF
jgi:carbohydrate-selective porin OprB